MNWDFAEACHEEASFCARHYDKNAYWKYMHVDECWFSLYQMGCEL